MDHASLDAGRGWSGAADGAGCSPSTPRHGLGTRNALGSWKEVSELAAANQSCGPNHVNLQRNAPWICTGQKRARGWLG